jgi:1-acyl-sn-glycerol-3-phosphate acyltransferase
VIPTQVRQAHPASAFKQALSVDPSALDARTVALACISSAIVMLTAVALVPIGALTLFRTRRLYAWVARLACRAILRVYGITVRVHQTAPFPITQTIYISNHTSTLDLFVLVALGLPNCRFFLSGFLKTIAPLGFISWMMGTFFTVPQDRPAERTRIFQRADRILRRTGESVYLSPEGARITTGQIGHFNKGAFHLATSLHVPIVPFFIAIPPDVDPGRGIAARPGVIDVTVMPAIDTRTWTIDDLERNKERVRDQFVNMQRRR